MIRLLLASLFIAGLAVGCTGAGPVVSPGVPAEGDAARSALCSSSGDASLTGLADRLDLVDPNVDTAQLQLALGSVSANLGQLNVVADQATARDAAVTAVQQVQGALANPSTLPEVAASAASAMRQLDTSIC